MQILFSCSDDNMMKYDENPFGNQKCRYVFFEECRFLFACFIPPPFINGQSQTLTSPRQVGSSKNSTEQLSFWERCCTHRQYQGVEIGEGGVFFHDFFSQVYS